MQVTSTKLKVKTKRDDSVKLSRFFICLYGKILVFPVIKDWMVKDFILNSKLVE